MAMRPMLSGKLNWDKLRFPCYVSPKVDGIRCVIDGGQGRSRTWKALPNQHIQASIKAYASVLEGVDGEIVVGSPTHKEVYNKSMSGVMSEWGTPDFTYLVFDLISTPRRPYLDRLKELRSRSDKLPPWVTILPQMLCTSRYEVETIEEQFIEEGYEGIIVRSPNAPYKFGRSTVNEGYLLKLKRYADAEARIIGFEELFHNDNPAQLDAQGYTRRTSHKANQRAGGVLGALQCQLLSDPSIEFGIGTGMDLEQRKDFWERREELLGQIVKFKYMPHGMLESTGAPRHPVFLGLRDPMDM